MTDQDLLAEYERRFRANPDPWNMRTSAYEKAKRAATLEACGPERRGRILELGAANGVLAEALASRGDAVVAVEAVPAAAALARARLAAVHGASVVEGLVPQAVPPGPYDLVVASEILYYLDEPSYRMTLRLLPGWMAPAGRLVAVHWRKPGPERPRSADLVHADLAALKALTRVTGNGSEGAEYRLDVFERVR